MFARVRGEGVVWVAHGSRTVPLGLVRRASPAWRHAGEIGGEDVPWGAVSLCRCDWWGRCRVGGAVLWGGRRLGGAVPLGLVQRVSLELCLGCVVGNCGERVAWVGLRCWDLWGPCHVGCIWFMLAVPLGLVGRASHGCAVQFGFVGSVSSGCCPVGISGVAVVSCHVMSRHVASGHVVSCPAV